jgi:hypothetical protein
MSEIFVLANGPSLRGFDFTRLNNYPTLGMNAAYRYWETIDWYPDYYCCLDTELIKTHHNQITELMTSGKIKKMLLAKSYFHLHPEMITNENMYTVEQLRNNLYFKSTKPNYITTGGYALRFAMYLGYDIVYVLGIDARYVEILPEAKKISNIKLQITKTPTHNPNYFFDDYQRAGDHYHVPNPHCNIHRDILYILRNDMQKFKMNKRVINLNNKSVIYDENIFPYKDIDSVLNENNID